MRKLLLSFVLAIMVSFVFGQHDLGLKLNGGASYVNTNHYSNSKDQKDRIQFSGQGGVYYNYDLPKNFMVGAELLFIQIEGKNYTKILFTDEQGQYTGEYGTNNIRLNISYLGVPVYFGYRIKKFTINLGFQVNYMLTGSSIQKFEATYQGEDLSYETIHKKLAMDNFDYGPRIGFTYGFSKRFSLEANYYYGLNNLLPQTNTQLRRNVQQFTAGLRIKLFKMPQMVH
jgi:hypothetical protein